MIDCACGCGEETAPRIRRDGLVNRYLRGHQPRSGRPRRPEVGYGAAHYRQQADYGKASAYQCVDCGEQAREWSQVHGTSTFEPRCKSCHNRYDGIGTFNRGSQAYLKRSRDLNTGRWLSS